jgi:hypothetical protein
MAWTTRVKASDGKPLLLCYHGHRDPKGGSAVTFINPRTRSLEAVRLDPGYPLTWTSTGEGECPDDATHVSLR